MIAKDQINEVMIADRAKNYPVGFSALAFLIPVSLTPVFWTPEIN
jgi:hypothetical protein